MTKFKMFSENQFKTLFIPTKSRGGGTESFGVVLTQELAVLAILYGGAKHFHTLRGPAKSFTVLRGRGGAEKIDQ